VEINVPNYIERIGYQGELRPTLFNLARLQKTHLLNVPFENLDIHYDVTIDLDLTKIYDKLVVRKRGGFCYELNGLFAQLLRQLGYKTRIVSARVYKPEQQHYGQEYDHLAIIVTLDQTDYLVDVGFGEFIFNPLELNMGKVQSDPRGDFILEKQADGYIKVSRLEGDKESPEYIFKEKERDFSEFSGMCHYHQTSPDSHFPKKKLISRPTENGRVTLTNTLLKITEGTQTIRETPFEASQFGHSLKEWFGLDETLLNPSKSVD